ncbi:flagellar biosynthetic protein FliQ [Buchnera aphidicola]|uniref:flagellar biosynthetic protein FliQ n=1 Tax=Buchnera aphidicola TaxID=9 RepID=UPI00346499A5
MHYNFIEAMFYSSVKVMLFVLGPILLCVLFVGFCINIIQSALQINEQTLSFIPKLISIILIFICFGSWMLNLILEYIKSIFSNIMDRY